MVVVVPAVMLAHVLARDELHLPVVGARARGHVGPVLERRGDGDAVAPPNLQRARRNDALADSCPRRVSSALLDLSSLSLLSPPVTPPCPCHRGAIPTYNRGGA